jgi:hypothetical protein
MKTILTAVILLAAIHAFAEKTPEPVVPANTNVTGSITNKTAPAKTDAHTGATRKDKKKK